MIGTRRKHRTKIIRHCGECPYHYDVSVDKYCGKLHKLLANANWQVHSAERPEWCPFNRDNKQMLIFK